MTTPPVPDEEFYAQFRQGLERYPEQPADLAGWARLQQSLDAEARRLARRRRWFGGGLAVLFLLLWLGLYWGPAIGPTTGSPPLVSRTGREQAAGTPAAMPTPVAAAGRGGEPPLAGSSPVGGQRPRLGTPGVPPVNPGQSVPANSSQSTDAAANRPAHPSPVPLPAGVAPTPRSGEEQGAPLRVAAGDEPRRGHPQRRRDAPSGATPAATAAAVPTRTGSAPARGRRPGAESRPRRLRPEALPLAGGTEWSARPVHLRPSAPRTRDEPRGPAGRQEVLRRGMGYPLLPAQPDNRARTSSAAPASGVTSAAATAAGGGALDPLLPRFSRLYLPLAPLPDRGELVARTPVPPAADSTAPPRPTALTAYRLRLGLVAAPELSAVRPSQLAAPGRNLGLQLDYRLGRRWRLSVAYLQTVKRYVARGTDYSPPAYYVPPRTWRIDGVAADCRIVDVPLNLRYDLWQRSRYQVFTSAGLSSLLMQREAYTYTYEQVSGRNRPAETVEVRTNARHVLQILNLSAGFEHAVGQRWSVQAEPFVKLPLGGIGFGDVRLGSAGVFLSLRYGLRPLRAGTPAVGAAGR